MRLLSRRGLLLWSTNAAGAAAIELSSRPASADKLSQRVVAYQDHPDGERRCDRCSHFQPPAACQIVVGTVRPDGYCRFFAPRLAS
jgi:hypothetical protein